MITKNVQLNEDDMSIQDEKLIQEELIDMRDSFQKKDVIDKQVIVAEYIGKNEFLYNSKEYYLEPYNNLYGKTPSVGTKIFIPIFVLEFQKLQLKFSPGWFKDINAAKEVLNNNEYILGILRDSNLTVDRNNNSLLQYINKIYNDNYKFRFLINGDIFLSGFFPFIFYFVISIIINDNTTSDLMVQLVLGSAILALIPVIIIYGIRVNMDNNFKNFKKIEGLDLSDNKKQDYKIIRVDTTISSDSLQLYSKELDCKWIFEKDEMNILSDKGRKLLNNSEYVDDNSLMVSVSKHWSNDSISKSEDDTWWIESLEN